MTEVGTARCKVCGCAIHTKPCKIPAQIIGKVFNESQRSRRPRGDFRFSDYIQIKARITL
jgi:hypothetical protein